MKILAQCKGGQVRSVGVKYFLTYILQDIRFDIRDDVHRPLNKETAHDVLACGWESNSLETRRMLYEWADKIILVKPDHKQHVPEEYHHKLILWNIGEDIYGSAFHPQLQKLIAGFWTDIGLCETTNC